MPETPQFIGEARFPKTGAAWVPLPRGKQANRMQQHAVQTINATPDEVYNTYARIELLPSWQEGIISVERTGAKTLHWKAEDPGTGKQMEFDSEELEKVPGHRHISRITSGPFAPTTATLTLEPHPAGRGTITTLITDMTFPAGRLLGPIAAVISRSPEQMVIENLRHLKELIESGQIPTVEGQPAGPRGVTGKFKQFLLGENLPTPPGTRSAARPEDMPRTTSRGATNPSRNRALEIAGYALIPFMVAAMALIVDNRE